MSSSAAEAQPPAQPSEATPAANTPAQGTAAAPASAADDEPPPPEPFGEYTHLLDFGNLVHWPSFQIADAKRDSCDPIGCLRKPCQHPHFPPPLAECTIVFCCRVHTFWRALDRRRLKRDYLLLEHISWRCRMVPTLHEQSWWMSAA